MGSPTKTIHIEPGSEADSLLKEADNAPVQVESDGSRYLLTRMEDIPVDEPDSILNVTGIWASDEPTDIADNKREYLAEAIEHKCDG